MTLFSTIFSPDGTPWLVEAPAPPVALPHNPRKTALFLVGFVFAFARASRISHTFAFLIGVVRGVPSIPGVAARVAVGVLCALMATTVAPKRRLEQKKDVVFWRSPVATQ